MEVKWIKISTNVFNDEKILVIESFPSADTIIVIWFKLLMLAGKTNNNGIIMLSDKIPYNEEMLAAIFHRKQTDIKMALNVFEKLGMIEIIDNVITVPNWEKYQSLDKYEQHKERDRLYQKERRRIQKERVRQAVQGIEDHGGQTTEESGKDTDITVPENATDAGENGNPVISEPPFIGVNAPIELLQEYDSVDGKRNENVTENGDNIDVSENVVDASSTNRRQVVERRPLDIDIDKDKNNNTLSTNVANVFVQNRKTVLTQWNSMAAETGIRSIKAITDRRKELVDARLKQYGLDGILQAIDNVRKSRFLQGHNKNSWMISFDWFIKPNNFIKVYEGNYTDGSQNGTAQGYTGYGQMDGIERVERINSW